MELTWAGTCHSVITVKNIWHLLSIKEDLDRIAEMGFDHVRVPVDYNILETEDGTPHRKRL